jgi:hypothetical protein
MQRDYVGFEIAPARKTGYADLNSLRNCLALYFAGLLDELDLSRLWMRCENLIPGNPLAGQLDVDTLRQCLFSLPEPERTAIALFYEPTDGELQQQMVRCYVHSDADRPFTDYLQQVYSDGVLRLSEVVYGVL